jgi:hypothetical protein
MQTAPSLHPVRGVESVRIVVSRGELEESLDWIVEHAEGLVERFNDYLEFEVVKRKANRKRKPRPGLTPISCRGTLRPPTGGVTLQDDRSTLAYRLAGGALEAPGHNLDPPRRRT